MNSIVTRFAPSPTGNLHIGSIRTALLNYIITEQTKKNYPNSKFLLRIEDTDKKRSTKEYKENINCDGDPFIQYSNLTRHQEVALELIKQNKAFKCICTVDFLEKKRIKNKEEKNSNKRLCETCENNKDIQDLEKNYVVRIKVPIDGNISINDKIQGSVTVNNNQIDDFILLRKDGSPTYMLSVVVDDFDMNVNLIIRGDDHLNNTFRQLYIYKKLNWSVPMYAHIPLIHGEDGKKLSKRHGALDVKEFKKKGYLKQSLINNLILLGWSPGKEKEIIEMEEIIEIYKLDKLSKSSSVFNYDKLNFFNNYYIKQVANINNFLDYSENNIILKKCLEKDKEKLLRLFSIYKEKLNFYEELESVCLYYFDIKNTFSNNKLFTEHFNLLIKDFYGVLRILDNWEKESLDEIIKSFITKNNIKFFLFGKPLRFLLISQENGPSISDIFFILGKKNSIERIKNYIGINYG